MRKKRTAARSNSVGSCEDVGQCEIIQSVADSDQRGVQRCFVIAGIVIDVPPGCRVLVLLPADVDGR